MDFYNKHILPRYLNWTMKNDDFEQHRIDVVSKVSGTGIEIGFGSGLNLPYYKNISKLYALEPSRELFVIANKNIAINLLPIEHLENSAENIPLPDNSLDFAISTWTLCSIPNPEIALKEVFRVLKNGGTFSFVEHGKSPVTFISKIQNLLTPFSKRIAGGCHINRDIENLVRNSGFQIQKIEKFSKKSKPLGFTYKGIAIARK